MDVQEREMLKKLFSFPLVSHAEVEEKGTLYLEAVARWCANAVVGCKSIQGAGADSRLYWIKEESSLLSATNKGPLDDTLQKRSLLNDAQFVSPLIQHGPSSTKKPRLIPSNSPDAGREDSPDGGEGSSPTGGGGGSLPAERERPGEKQLNRSASGEKLKVSAAASGEKVMELVREKTVLEGRIQVKEEQLRRLKMVKMYRNKNNLEQLDELISKWREVCQEAAELLLSQTTRQPPPDMHQLLDHFHIDHALIQYSSEDESFY